MRVLLMLLAALLHATSTVNSLKCWDGISLKAKAPSKPEEVNDNWKLSECPAGIKHCFKFTCPLDTEDVREMSPGETVPDGTVGTMTFKGCLATEGGKCDIPNEINGRNMGKVQKKCGISCCT
uniref:Secreted protein n=1 Tax=Globodera pallida TaxID=36090 RepID=A0A183CRV6_GLOPA